MLLKDGVRYFLHTYNNEHEFEKMIFDHFKDVFGENTILLPKKKIQSRSGIKTVPDAFVLSVEEKKWFIIEVELESHPLYDHIVSQISKFNSAIKNEAQHKKLIKAFYDEITGDPLKNVELEIKGIREKFKYISEVVESRPEIVIFIDRESKELDDVFESLPFSSRIVVFKTYCRENVGIEDSIHEFESLVELDWKTPTDQLAEKKPLLNGRKELSETNLFQKKFWEELKVYLNKKHTFLKLRTPRARHWYNFGVGNTRFNVTLTLNKRKKLIGCELYIKGKEAKKEFEHLKREKSSIEKEIGRKLDWRKLPKGQDCRIILYTKVADIEDKSKWDDYFRWCRKYAEKFHKAFSKRVKKIKAE